LKPINDRESSDERISVNQNGNENFVQKSIAPRSGKMSFLKNLDAKTFPAVFASARWRYRGWTQCT